MFFSPPTAWPFAYRLWHTARLLHNHTRGDSLIRVCDHHTSVKRVNLGVAWLNCMPMMNDWIAWAVPLLKLLHPGLMADVRSCTAALPGMQLLRRIAWQGSGGIMTGVQLYD